MALQVPFVQKYCTCTDELYNPCHLGKRQREYETLRLSGISIAETLNKMKIVKLCCREALFNPTTLFLNNENRGRIYNDVGQDIRKRIETKKDTDDFLPTRELPPLP